MGLLFVEKFTRYLVEYNINASLVRKLIISQLIAQLITSQFKTLNKLKSKNHLSNRVHEQSSHDYLSFCQFVGRGKIFVYLLV